MKVTSLGDCNLVEGTRDDLLAYGAKPEWFPGMPGQGKGTGCSDPSMLRRSYLGIDSVVKIRKTSKHRYLAYFPFQESERIEIEARKAAEKVRIEETELYSSAESFKSGADKFIKQLLDFVAFTMRGAGGSGYSYDQDTLNEAEACLAGALSAMAAGSIQYDREKRREKVADIHARAEAAAAQVRAEYAKADTRLQEVLSIR